MRWLGTLALVTLALISSAGMATANQDGCLTAECHGDLGKARYPHQPAASGECARCHRQKQAGHPEVAGAFALVAPENELCLQCHPGRTEGGDRVHSAVAGGCTSCHDPHGGPFPAMLPATGGQLCARCHADPTAGLAIAHPPVASGNCALCHKPHAGFGEALLIVPPGDLCNRCHRGKTAGMSFLHTPVAAGECTSCHGAHGGQVENLLPVTGSQLCDQCHESKREAAVLHGPVEGGNCSACHDVHGSQARFQLLAPGNDLCYVCHGDKAALKTMKNVHPVVLQGCTSCHDPHGEAERYMLPADGVTLCTGCHEAVGREVADPASPHGAVADGGCVACHDPHGNGNYKMFLAPANRICFNCHQDMQQVVEASPYQHGPVEAGECWVCHNPHGSPYKPLLNSYYPEEFYTGFELGNYDLCFACHDLQAFVYDRTAELTGFRNGDRNLHHLHVNRPAKSRVCKSCHGVHGADQPKLIKSRIPGFGAWEIPIRFTQHDTGATCVVGCHKPKTYDRVKPVTY